MIAYVATLLLGSAMRFSRSTLQAATLAGCVRASAARVRVAANFKTGLGDERNSCRTAWHIEKKAAISDGRRQTCDRLGQLCSSYVFHLADGTSGFKVHHVTLMP